MSSQSFVSSAPSHRDGRPSSPADVPVPKPAGVASFRSRFRRPAVTVINCGDGGGGGGGSGGSDTVTWMRRGGAVTAAVTRVTPKMLHAPAADNGASGVTRPAAATASDAPS